MLLALGAQVHVLVSEFTDLDFQLRGSLASFSLENQKHFFPGGPKTIFIFKVINNHTQIMSCKHTSSCFLKKSATMSNYSNILLLI